MGLIDFILNLAGLLLWLNWRTSGFDPLARATPATLAGTLRRAGPARFKRWHFPLLLAGLVVLRALFYWQIGSAVRWTATMDLGVISLSFRSDLFWRMILFSVLSFAATLAIFFLWLLLLSLLRRPGMDADPMHRLVRHHLGMIDRWPLWLKALLPWLVGTAAWWVLSWLFVRWGIVPPAVTLRHLLEQSLVIGLCAYLPWKILLAAIFLLYLASTYVYLGNHPFWSYLNGIARTLLAPLRALPLRVGRVDFAPVIGLIVTFGLAHLVQSGIEKLYFKLPI